MANIAPITVSIIPPDPAGALTVCAHEGSRVWRKTYRTEHDAWLEMESLGMTIKTNMGTRTKYVADIRRQLISEASVDMDELQRRGYKADE
ncbi:hypothetical protein [Edaphobacter albus]|uniref:hypothetical protein n=1 Tax=Edaphobacter sp. 4G125 TaxID=2763071 RepID=UPI001648A535|nr:hypothetical protein [Edaphobacter sp. 4G125]QNI37503.1 hypothetical protein H7846_04155 [Edaphobacter sp. 4G125]